MVKKQCLHLDLSKVDFNKSATWNIYKQLNLDIDNAGKKYKVTDFYIPQKEQDRFLLYFIENHKKCKYYKKSRFQKDLIWEVLGYFPSAVKKRSKNDNSRIYRK